MKVCEGYKRCVECNLDVQDGIEYAENSPLAAYLCPECWCKSSVLYMQRGEAVVSNSEAGAKAHLGGSWQKIVPVTGDSERNPLSDLSAPFSVSVKTVHTPGVKLISYSGPYFVAWSTVEKRWEVIDENDSRSDRALLFWDERSKTNVYGPFQDLEEAERIKSVIAI